MTNKTPSKPWSVEQRLEFIEFMAYWEGSLNRSFIVSHFGVSPQQASNDLAAYQLMAPDNLWYDLRAKRYAAAPDFVCKLIEPDADRYLRQLTALTMRTVQQGETWLDGTLAADVIPTPARRVDPSILRGILAAIRAKRSMEIEYLSLSSGASERIWRRVTPHAFGSDGFRWHMRAFCHRDEKFKDFLLSRCGGTRNAGEPGQDAGEDQDWNEYFDAILTSNPRLSDAQREVIELDYGMIEGKVNLSIRYALLYYFEKRLGADFAPSRIQAESGDPRENPIVISNLEEYGAALHRVGVKKR